LQDGGTDHLVCPAVYVSACTVGLETSLHRPLTVT